MANKKFVDFTPEVTAIANGDLYLIQDTSAGTTNYVEHESVVAGVLSADTDNILGLGTDSRLNLETADLISADADNAVVEGTDGKLFASASGLDPIANLRVLGNVSGSSAVPSAVTVLDDDTMATASATTLATSESIKAYVDSLGGVAPAYESIETSFSNGTTYTFAHSLGRLPYMYQVTIKCTTTDRGYAVGDEILLSNTFSNTSDGSTTSMDTTNIKVTIGSSANPLFVSRRDPTVGAAASLTLTSWRLIVRAW